MGRVTRQSDRPTNIGDTVDSCDKVPIIVNDGHALLLISDHLACTQICLQRRAGLEYFGVVTLCRDLLETRLNGAVRQYLERRS